MKMRNAISAAKKGSKFGTKRKRSIKSGADEALEQDAAGEDEDDVEIGLQCRVPSPSRPARKVQLLLG
ncbi:uncharacterized protein MYCFIDRAFT_210015 [Pseudocercospora fijiensis CIRAD86]|uniref:Uncharacterized protein n=1 Tax=Pseudocercospora fijiensis (strain CIRAD86) TaxID=383855 RepID=N1QCD9_PSEFD|nr:uncharacterized protein MYCFIDRAFT_210015 [Pseudocercospora fijiensis CIRAD86]EME89182.1 hypothetical protein MYCFIDRAFT_210015 [Pseudocercospora fijiensis CIRAD86]